MDRKTEWGQLKRSNIKSEHTEGRLTKQILPTFVVLIFVTYIYVSSDWCRNSGSSLSRLGTNHRITVTGFFFFFLSHCFGLVMLMRELQSYTISFFNATWNTRTGKLGETDKIEWHMWDMEWLLQGHRNGRLSHFIVTQISLSLSVPPIRPTDRQTHTCLRSPVPLCWV